MNIFESIFSSAPDSLSSSRIMAFLLILMNISATLFLVFHNNAIPANILVFSESTCMILLSVLAPSKVLEYLNRWKNDK